MSDARDEPTRVDFASLVAEIGELRERVVALEADREARRTERLEAAPARDLLTPTQAAAYLSIAPRTLRELKRKGRVPYVMVGGLPRYNREELDRWRLTGCGRTGTSRLHSRPHSPTRKTEDFPKRTGLCT